MLVLPSQHVESDLPPLVNPSSIHRNAFHSSSGVFRTGAIGDTDYLVVDLLELSWVSRSQLSNLVVNQGRWDIASNHFAPKWIEVQPPRRSLVIQCTSYG